MQRKIETHALIGKNGLTGAVLRVLLVLRMKIVDRVGHDVPGVHGFLQKYIQIKKRSVQNSKIISGFLTSFQSIKFCAKTSNFLFLVQYHLLAFQIPIFDAKTESLNFEFRAKSRSLKCKQKSFCNFTRNSS